MNKKIIFIFLVTSVTFSLFTMQNQDDDSTQKIICNIRENIEVSTTEIAMSVFHYLNNPSKIDNSILEEIFSKIFNFHEQRPNNPKYLKALKRINLRILTSLANDRENHIPQLTLVVTTLFKDNPTPSCDLFTSAIATYYISRANELYIQEQEVTYAATILASIRKNNLQIKKKKKRSVPNNHHRYHAITQKAIKQEYLTGLPVYRDF